MESEWGRQTGAKTGTHVCLLAPPSDAQGDTMRHNKMPLNNTKKKLAAVCRQIRDEDGVRGVNRASEYGARY